MNIAVISLATDRSNDPVGELMETSLRGQGNVARETIQPDLVRLKGVTLAAVADPRFDALIVVGELTAAGREAVVAQINAMMERRLDGFSQAARNLLMEREGSSAIFSWTCAGAVGRRLLMALPGSPAQLQIWLEKLVLPSWPELLDWSSQ